MESTTAESGCPNCRRLERQVEALKAELAELRRKLDEQTRSQKRQTAPFRRKKRLTKRKRPGRKKGHPPAQRKAPEKVDRIVDVPAEKCPDCDIGLVDKQVHVQFQTDLPPIVPTVTQFNVECGVCPECGRRVQGRHPEQTSDALGAAANQLGPRVLSLAVDMKYRLGVPFRKVSDFFQTLAGLHVEPSTIARAAQRLANQSEPTYEALQEDLRSQGLVVHGDETGWRIDVSGAWLWVFSSCCTTVYVIRESRGHEVIEEVLGQDFSEPLVCDGFAAYDATDYLTPRCNQHVLRRIEGLLETADRTDRKYLEQLQDLWYEALDLGKRRRQMSPQGYRRRRSEILNRFDAWLGFHGRRPGKELARLAKHLEKHRDEWFLHLFDQRIPPTNNHAERMLKPPIVGRKIGACNKTPAGAKTYQVITSIATTLWQRGGSFVRWAIAQFTLPSGWYLPAEPLPDG